MPKRRTAAVSLRNDQIYAEWIRKPDLPALAEKHGVTPQRIGQIIASYNPDLETEHERALLKGGLWNLVHEIQGVIEAPGFKLAPNGHLATDDDGEPVPDTMAKIEAIKVKKDVYKNLAQLVGAEKVQPKQLTVQFDVAHQQMQKDLEDKRRELEDARRAALQPPVVPGEVVSRGELPSGGAQDQQRGDGG